ncbi:hypothetical protein C6501_19755 [Candidatus Poribacteria bacterium]|nr:MAG: hypothetical protein C6501_19755 [Candidatus Poribacteria bacterium]
MIGANMPQDETSKEQELREFYRSLITHFPDRSMKWLLQDKENVRCLIEIVASELVERIDFSQLELQNRSFVSNTLREQESDLLFSVPFKKGDDTDELLIYILIEHQSVVDVSMGFRMLFYMMNIWDAQRKEWVSENVPKREWKLSPILPIVLYSGDRRWRVPLSLTAIMEIPDILTRFVPTFDTVFLSVKETGTEELTKTGHPFGSLLTVLKNEKADKDTIIRSLNEAIAHLNTLEPEQSEQRLNALHYLVLLITNRRPQTEHEELIDFVKQNANDMEIDTMAKTMAEVYIEQGKMQGIEQGKKEGKKEGIEQGETLAKQTNVIKLLTHQFPETSDTIVNAILEIKECSQLDALFDQILNAKTYDDIDLNGIGSQ